MNESAEKISAAPVLKAKRSKPFELWKVVFAAIFLLGILIRLAHITQESVWWDEFATVAFLKPPPAYEASPYFAQWNQTVIRQPSPHLGDFLRQNRGLDPAAMPMYLALEYYWNKHVHASPTALRLLSVLFGLALLPLLFVFGKRLYGVQAGLFAMFCVSMSPIHVQFSREIRMYGLMTLLALISVHAFYHILEDRRRRWWFLYGISTLLLSWTHPFALLLPLVQGLFWLFLFMTGICFPARQTCDLSKSSQVLPDFKRLFSWGALTAIMTLPAALWVLTIQFWGQDSTEAWMRAPNFMEFVNDVFADDAIGATYQVNATPLAWMWFTSETAARWIISWRWAIGRGFLIAAVASLFWVSVAAPLIRRRNASRTTLAFTATPPLKWNFFLALWLMVPPLTLYILSVLWRPCHQPRYTVHSSLALYLLLGGAIAMLPRRAPRLIAGIGLVLFFAYQQMLMLGEPQHPDWLGASKMIREEANADDLVLAHNWLWKRVFSYNLGPVPNVVCYGSGYDILAEKSAFFLDLDLPSADSSGNLRSVWVVVQTDYFTTGAIAPLEQEFSARGLVFDAFEFGGIQRVILYHVRHGENTPPYAPKSVDNAEMPKEFCDLSMEFWRSREYTTAIAAARAALQVNPHHARAWSYLGMSFKELEQSDQALEAFKRAIEIDPADYPWSLNNYAELLIGAEQYEEAVKISLQALEVLQGDGWSQALLGRAYFSLGDYAKARDALRQAVQSSCQDLRIPQWLDEVEKAVAAGAQP